MAKPSIVLVGPHKSGTTWIDNYLRYRGDVLLPRYTKETFFFDKQFHRGMEWYEKQFGEMESHHKLCVEVAPSLLDKPVAAERLAKELPDVTVVCTLRNPIDRAVAHFFHHLKGGETDNGFAVMAQKHPELLHNGFYYKHIQMWERLLSPEQVKILRYEDLNRDPAEYCQTICGLLGLEYKLPPEDVLSARINEDGDPNVRLLAKLARRGAETLRSVGLHGIVNIVRQPAVRRLAYGAPPTSEKRERVRQEAMAFYDEFFSDFKHLDTAYEIDTSSWRTQRRQ